MELELNWILPVFWLTFIMAESTKKAAGGRVELGVGEFMKFLTKMWNLNATILTYQLTHPQLLATNDLK